MIFPCNLSNLRNLLVLTGLSVFLTACLTTVGLEKGPGALLSTGLISGELGRDLDQKTKRKAIDAEVAALSNGATGTETKWTGAKNTSGKVVPGQPFEVSGQSCRRYTHVISVSGQIRSGQTTACKNEDGIWEPLQ